MNFLSHYYFDRKIDNPYLITGAVLPDLVKNAHKDWNLYPQKNTALFISDENENALLKGWQNHLKVDAIFHSSDFFTQQTAILKKQLIPILQESVVRPSFLAHIGLELLLDHILIERQLVNMNLFYEKLDLVEENVLKSFLLKCGVQNDQVFFNFFNNYKSSKYLFNYQKIENISYALQRICLRLWPQPLSQEMVLQLTQQLIVYKTVLEEKFMLIFEQIESHLNR